MAPSHYLNQYWIIVNCILGNKHQWSSNHYTTILICENRFKNVICKLANWQPFCLDLDVLTLWGLIKHNCSQEMTFLNMAFLYPCGAETWIFWHNLVNTMAVDALAPHIVTSSAVIDVIHCGNSSSAAILIVEILVFLGYEFCLPASFQRRKIFEIIIYFQKNATW